ncbi:MAG: glycosyltransferase, partial [Muribaculaceae bacterium]|nr:glycosyltransferase [Muribaculaceae bacterium]
MQRDYGKQQISVIIPIYNGEEWLRGALDSLRNQTHTEFEAIMINDGSSDDSEKICMDFAASDSRFQLINQENEGVSAARNKGLENAKGEWIAFLDADDTLTPDALEVLISLQNETKAGIVAASYVRGKDNIKTHNGTGHSIVNSEEAIKLGLYQKRILNTPAGILFSSTIFNGEKPLRFRRCRYEDLDMFYQAFERVEDVCLTDRIVYFYRDNPDSFINTWSDSRLDVLDVTDRIVRHMKNCSEQLHKAALDRRFSAHFNMLVEMERYGVDNPTQKERCIKVIKEQRLNELKNPNVRIKNKLGALISYLGMPAISMLCK